MAFPEDYGKLQKKINELLYKYGSAKLLILLNGMSEDIDDAALVAVEKILSICAKYYTVTKRQVLQTNLKNENVVYARRAAIYILSKDINLTDDNIKDLFKFEKAYRVSQILAYTDDCIVGEKVDMVYLNQLAEIRADVKKVIDNLRKLEQDKEDNNEK